MQETYHHYVRAFTGEGLAGNLAVVLLASHKSNFNEFEERQAIARQLNAPASVFVVSDDHLQYRLFCHSPTTEIQFCGHGTLAAAYVIFTLKPDLSEISATLNTKSLKVSRAGADTCTLIAPAFPLADIRSCAPEQVFRDRYPSATECYQANGIDLLLLDSVDAVRDFELPAEYCENGGKYLAVTAAGENARIYSRYFPVASGLTEDSVTGSLHFILAPFWCKRLQVDVLDCFQLSRAGGYLHARLIGEELHLTGHCQMERLDPTQII